MWLKKYSAGTYVDRPQSRWLDLGSRYIEYLKGVTLARQDINRLKPAFLEGIHGDVLEIGGYDDYFKRRYTRGRFLNLDLVKNEHVDIVADARRLDMFDDNSLGGVLCLSVLEHCPTPQKIVDEIYRVLCPGGRALISNPWLFESHMEPNDFLRFSCFISEVWFARFRILDVHLTNSYFGLVAHVLQNSRLLRATLGTPFFFADQLAPKTARWSTQLTYTLEK